MNMTAVFVYLGDMMLNQILVPVHWTAEQTYEWLVEQGYPSAIHLE